jgi:hypothetical protein
MNVVCSSVSCVLTLLSSSYYYDQVKLRQDESSCFAFAHHQQCALYES